MEKEIVTTRTKTYRDNREGDLVYQYGNTSIERTDDHIIIKVMAEKHQNWLQLADFLNCAVTMVKSSELNIIERDAEWEAFRDEEFAHADNPDVGCTFDYRYFYDIRNWVMYENDFHYLFVYETENIDNAPEDLKAMLDFLTSWYYRVTGTDEDV